MQDQMEENTSDPAKKKIRRNIYFAHGIVNVQIKPPTKTKAAYWIKKKFEGAVVAGVDEEDAKKDLTAKRIFPSKEHKWLREKKIQIIEVSFKFLNKSNYY